MIPEIGDPNQTGNERRDITSTHLFTAFAHKRRQQSVVYLARKPAGITIGVLAEHLGINERKPTY